MLVTVMALFSNMFSFNYLEVNLISKTVVFKLTEIYHKGIFSSDDHNFDIYVFSIFTLQVFLTNLFARYHDLKIDSNLVCMGTFLYAACRF